MSTLMKFDGEKWVPIAKVEIEDSILRAEYERGYRQGYSDGLERRKSLKKSKRLMGKLRKI